MSTNPAIMKRDGSTVAFNFQKIVRAVAAAWSASGRTGEVDPLLIRALEDANLWQVATVENIQNQIEHTLFVMGYEDVFKAFSVYRANRALLRENNTHKVFRSIIDLEKNDVTNDNANMNQYSPAGMMAKFASVSSKAFTSKYLLSDRTRAGIRENRLYVHDLDYYSTRAINCLQAPLDRLLTKGFKAGHGEARPAKRIETAAVIACICLQTTQNEMFGGQAIPAFDFYMAPYVRSAYIEEVNKIRDLLVDKENTEFWDAIRNAAIKDYEIKELPMDVVNGPSSERILQQAINATVKRVRQAMESLVHNFNSIHSRGGNQTVFSSLNYGTDTSAEGRCVIRELLKTTMEGVGNGATAIFPIQIWKCKSGVSVDPGDRNYDLFQYACKVSARRFFPNFLNLDASFNKDEAWDASDPRRFEHEVATMGCRTRVYENIHGPKTSIGRGNLSFTTINLPGLAIETAVETGYMKKVDGGYVIDDEHDTEAAKEVRLQRFFEKLHSTYGDVVEQLMDRIGFQSKAQARQFPLLMQGMWNGSEKLKGTDTIAEIIKQGTLAIGYIGLAEALIALIGKHHGESDEAQQLGLSIISTMHAWTQDVKKEKNLNFGVFATPAEGLSGRFTVIDREKYGNIERITDKDYYTNSNHVPVYYHISPMKKAEIEGPYHALTPAGHIFYVEADGDITKNPEAVEQVVRIARGADCGYISINHNQARCSDCNFEDNGELKLANGDTCPKCGGTISTLARVTGYLCATTNKFTFGKEAEWRDRVAHI